ncbi:alpha/beta-hydrolase [Metschnikowia bicuspidata]|uniref:Alpha/beta-hydrolase n=1 Tax=Metschnikowia bicuspidata TaxID=27322 RepID=A0A4P9ZAH6_9ASCO|nr:alpha/beta-hydrolase [Metschnikowia bicuspidata]
MLATNFCDPIRNFLPDSDVPRPLSRPEDLKLIKDNYFHLRDNYKPPKHPIVLCHGLAGFDSLILMQLPNFKANTQLGSDEPQQNISKMPSEITDSVKASSLALNYWYGIEEALVKAGIDVITAKVPPFESIAARAHLLDTLLSEKCKEFSGRRPGERVKLNLVGHSMGGLDARYLISKIQTSQSPYEVVSLTTVGTPHHGSEVADFVMEILEQSVFLSMICPAAITQLTTSYLAKFNTEIRNDPRVGYFSFGALMDPSRIKRFRVTYEIIKRTIKESGEQFPQNDGMVSVSLARWGNYLGTLDNFDHLDLINWTNPLKVPFSEQETFNSIALYLDIADILSQNGY